MLHVCRIVPCKRKTFSDLTGCETLAVYGYRFVCSCEERGKVRKTFALAGMDSAEHRQRIATLDT